MKSLQSSCIGARYAFKLIVPCFVLATGAMWYYVIQNGTCEHGGLKLPKQDSRAIVSIVTNDTACKVNIGPATTKCDSGQGAADKMRLNTDIFGQHFASASYVHSQLYGKSAPRFSVQPADIPNTAHYVWCGKKLFQFEHYLAVLSIVKVLKPMKLVFHYNQLPVVNQLYHTWFQELRQSLPYLVLQETNAGLQCNTPEVLNFGLAQLASSTGGGVYVGERAVLSYIPSYWKHEKYLTYFTPGTNSSEEVIIFTKQGLVEPNVTLETFKSKVLNKSYECLTSDKFNQLMTSPELVKSKTPDDILPPCLVAPKQIYPENIINNTTPFGGLARTLYYDKTEILVAKPSEDPNDLIPAISHMISLNPKPGTPVEFTFGHYLSILSALYLGGFERVYVHGDTLPKGQWWTKLQDENVTFVYIENIETVFQQGVKVLAHQSDILRTMILLKYGGAYLDKDALWVHPVPEDIRRYSTLACFDWVFREEWPRAFNLGVFMSKPGAPFLRHFLDSFWYQWDASWIFNGVQVPYKIYERHPETLYIYDRLQVICYMGVCHPIWHDDYVRSEKDAGKPTGKFELEDANALHFTYPKPDPSLASFDAIKKGNTLPAELGKKLVRAIENAGRKHLLA